MSAAAPASATDAVDDGVTGILVDGTSEESIADALNRLLSDKELARRMGEAGRRKVAQNFVGRKM